MLTIDGGIRLHTRISPAANSINDSAWLPTHVTARAVNSFHVMFVMLLPCENNYMAITTTSH